VDALIIHNTDTTGFSPYKKKMAKGLRITDLTPSTKDDGALSNRLEKLCESIVTKSSESNIEANFKAFLTNNLDVPTATSANKKLLADSIVATSELIKNNFGEKKANEFMATILQSTQLGLSETKLASAITSFFKKAAAEIYGTESFDKTISSVMEFLNKDLTTYFSENSSLSSSTTYGLSYAINKFFNNNEIGSVKHFNEAFEYNDYSGSLNSEDIETTNSEDGYFHIYFGSYDDSTSITISSEMFEQIYNFLADNIQNENASSYFASYGHTDYLNAISGAFAIITNEDGQEKAHAFQDFLNKNFSQKVSVDGKPLVLDWWLLGVDYSNPDEVYPDTVSDKRRLSGIMDADKEIEEIIAKGHQTLSVNWLDISSKVGTANAIDIDKLYDIITNATNQRKISSKTFVDLIV
jgi:hypothetical protein